MSLSVGLESVRADKRLLILPALFFLSPFVTAAVPRLTWLFVASIAIASGVRAWRQGVAWRTLVPLDAVSIAAALVALYVSISALWAADPSAGFAKAALLWGLVLLTVAACTALAALDERQLRLAALGFAAGAALGAIYVLFEMLTGAAITRAAMNVVPALRPDKLKHIEHVPPRLCEEDLAVGAQSECHHRDVEPVARDLGLGSGRQQAAPHAAFDSALCHHRACGPPV